MEMCLHGNFPFVHRNGPPACRGRRTKSRRDLINVNGKKSFIFRYRTLRERAQRERQADAGIPGRTGPTRYTDYNVNRATDGEDGLSALGSPSAILRGLLVIKAVNVAKLHSGTWFFQVFQYNFRHKSSG